MSDDFKMQLLKDIPYFHRVYAKYKNPVTLETIKNLGTVLKNLKQKHERTN